MTVALTPEPSFITEETHDVAVPTVVGFRSGADLKLSINSRDLAVVLETWTKADLKEPQTLVIKHSVGVTVVEMSQVQSINALTGSIRSPTAKTLLRGLD